MADPDLLKKSGAIVVFYILLITLGSLAVAFEGYHLAYLAGGIALLTLADYLRLPREEK